jgi:hypothetical protein
MVLVARLEGWLADRRTRLAHVWDALTYGNRVRRRRLAERFWARRIRLAEGSWVGRHWSGYLRERPTDWSRARHERRAARRAGRSPHSSAARAPTLAVASVLVVLVVAAAIAIGSFGGTPDSTGGYSRASLNDMTRRMAVPDVRGMSARQARSLMTRRMDVPDVRGMSARQARSLLERAGLTFERAIAAEGTPGRVLGTLPSNGHLVSSGRSVTLIVGVEAERLVAGLVSSLSSEHLSASP